MTKSQNVAKVLSVLELPSSVGVMKKKVLLLILDGLGISEHSEFNAVFKAKTPNLDYIHSNFPYSKLQASGLDVGLPKGVMGNSEVGHLTIGAGRIIFQDLVRINNFLKTKKFTELSDITRVCNLEGNLHLIGLVSDGFVHSSVDHLICLIEHISSKFPEKKLYIHMITDGRDTPTTSSLTFAKKLDLMTERNKNLFAASVMGRFFAMDRDKRWDRTRKAVLAIKGDLEGGYNSFTEAILGAHNKGEYDEFIVPSTLKGFHGAKKEDQFLFFNFRADRARQLSIKLCDNFIQKKNFLTMTEYSCEFEYPVLFSKVSYKNILSEVVANRGLRQLKLAETEKYAHVTYFLNGGIEKAFKNEERIMIESCKDVKTYDLKPEMRVFEITDVLIKKMKESNHDLIVTNFANPDMVGHTGNFNATVSALEYVDKCVGKILSLIDSGWTIVLTSDHGNCEKMGSLNNPFTSHTTNPVPIYIISNDKYKLCSGGLSDIAPTILKLLDLKSPNEMTGKALF